MMKMKEDSSIPKGGVLGGLITLLFLCAIFKFNNVIDINNIQLKWNNIYLQKFVSWKTLFSSEFAILHHFVVLWHPSPHAKKIRQRSWRKIIFVEYLSIEIMLVTIFKEIFINDTLNSNWKYEKRKIAPTSIFPLLLLVLLLLLLLLLRGGVMMIFKWSKACCGKSKLNLFWHNCLLICF